MERTGAQQEIVTRWLKIAEHRLGPAQIDESLTEEFEWGWVFVFVPINSETCNDDYKRKRYAFDRITGISCPVGTKGIEEAIIYLAKFRNRELNN